MRSPNYQISRMIDRLCRGLPVTCLYWAIVNAYRHYYRRVKQSHFVEELF